MLMILIIIVSTLLIGYRWGKVDGLTEGYERGATNLMLSLRRQSLEQGHCSLCDKCYLKADN